jgi:hypothetical protein
VSFDLLEVSIKDACILCLDISVIFNETLDGKTLDGETLDGETLDGETLDGETLESSI